MFVKKLSTSNPAVYLVEPEIERDAHLGVDWLNSEDGKKTLELMGNPTNKITKTSLEEEKSRVKDFIEKNNEINWMVELEGKVVGAIWVSLEPNESVKAPSIHIMIGDSSARGRGVGNAAFGAAMNWLIVEKVEKTIYTRHLASNVAASRLIYDIGFLKDGDVYTDEDSLEWQNAIFYSNNVDSDKK